MSRIVDLAKKAPKKPLEVWIGNINRTDLEGVDTPGDLEKKGKKVERYKIVEKAAGRKRKKAEKPEKKTKRKKPGRKAKKAKRAGRKLPRKREILEKAKEPYMKEQVKRGLPAITPEERELKETGTFEEARADLMRSEATKLHSQIGMYVDELKSELEPCGYTVVPAA